MGAGVASASSVVSAVSAVPQVRQRLVTLQRELASGSDSVVVEGRVAREHEPRQAPETLTDAVELGSGIGQSQTKPLMHVAREMFE